MNQKKTALIQRLVLAVLLCLASLSLFVGITAAWFTNQYRLSSVGKIHPPAYITIQDPGNTVIQAIDLSYDKSEIGEDGKVYLKRPFVIAVEQEQFDLCLAHTTNTRGLEIHLYRAENTGTQGNAYLAGISTNGTPYYWNKASETDLMTTGHYLNKTGTTASMTDEAFRETFRTADSTVYQSVQKNAAPLYWVSTGLKAVKPEGNDTYYANFILEITWLETDKETDLLYVVAQTHTAE